MRNPEEEFSMDIPVMGLRVPQSTGLLDHELAASNSGR